MPTPDSKLTCGSGLPCIYVDRNKWIPYEEVGNFKPPPILTESWKDEKTTLFIMIASFRDKLCPHTLFNAFTKAKYPARISIGVVDQVMPEDSDCLVEYCKLMKAHTKSTECLYESNIRAAKKSASESLVSLHAI